MANLLLSNLGIRSPKPAKANLLLFVPESPVVVSAKHLQGKIAYHQNAEFYQQETSVSITLVTLGDL